MKRIYYLVISILLFFPASLLSQNGKNCFNSVFNNSASIMDIENAYLLNYLSVMIYPQYLRYLLSPVAGLNDQRAIELENNQKFPSEFESKMWHLFTNKSSADYQNDVKFRFLHKCQTNGYDPEVMIISTPTTVYVVFRGTDRVDCLEAGTLDYTWKEWIGTDFDIIRDNVSKFNGSVHRGMWRALNIYSTKEKTFLEEICEAVKSYASPSKKIWATGHSLGGAFAQLFSLYLKLNYELSVQGVYTFASPHPGDVAFANQLNTEIGKQKIQRFEFSDDPAPFLLPQAPGFDFGRAGVRNLFRDYNRFLPAHSEQIPVIDDFRFINGVKNAVLSRINLTDLGGGSFCFHHPTFTLKGLRNQIPTGMLTGLPTDVPLPQRGDDCTTIELELAGQYNISGFIDGAIENVRYGLETITWNASSLLANMIGTSVPEGKYLLKNYAFSNKSNKYMEWNWNCYSDNELRCQIILGGLGQTTANNIFEVKKDGIGYRLSINGKSMEVNSSRIRSDGAAVWMNNRDDNPVTNQNQHWLFYKLPNSSNRYVILNMASGKILDAENSCNSQNPDCKIRQNPSLANDATQIWILEPVEQIKAQIPAGKYLIKSAECGKYLHVKKSENPYAYDLFQTCDKLQLNRIGDDKLNNEFKIEPVAGPLGGYTITSTYANRVLDIEFINSMSSNASINVCTRSIDITNRTHQEWYFDRMPDDSYIIYSVKSNLVLDASDECTSSSRLKTWRRLTSNDKTQRWILEKR